MKFLNKEIISKEIISVCGYSNVKSNRESTKAVIINGRSYLKHGTMAATTMVAVQYKVNSPSFNNKYIVAFGIAKQNPGDVFVDEQIGYEIAMENALINPVMVSSFVNKVDDDFMKIIMMSYISTLPIVFVKTKEELEKDGLDSTKFIRRKNGIKFNYYSNYYKDFRKKFAYKV